MFQRISNGLSLAGSTWRVLVRDKHLLAFPLVSGFLFLLVVASFAVPLATLVDWKQFEQHVHRNNNRPPVWVYAVAFAYYFCTYFVIVFCNSALISCALLRFNGQSPTLADGFRMALARLPQIFAWALVSATVGVLLKAVESAHEKVGEFVAGVLGTAWSVMTFFVVPVLVVEKVGPMAAIGRSAALLKKTWGEALVGNMGLSFILFLLLIPVVLLFVAGGWLLASGSTVPGAVLLVAGGISMLLHMAVGAALHTIFLAALYQFAADERVPEGFDRRVMETAFGRA
ncbi:DUF6159 family protein [Frigoriglobus tundricola]|uniref:Glycerophosphoryl diester phosphodiesterase membrane domain-containing protein n=1 Tax=Frigoriglobus tundricola TaxID=2774151 RepID=A0A6M5Z116_9BACT|nr:DUF6159 family protein [Frigoriglobus tundricola]QJW99330.1 hypothetical protein FTUN_6936 [Frigoriglobus tundricola]